MMNFPMMTRFQYIEFMKYCSTESKNKTNLIKDTLWMFLEDRGYDDIEHRVRTIFKEEFHGMIDRYRGYLEYIAECPELALLGCYQALKPKYYFQKAPSFSLKSLTDNIVEYSAQDISSMRISESIYDRALKAWHAKNKARESYLYNAPHSSPLRGWWQSIYADRGY